MIAQRRVWLEISLSRLRDNFRKIQEAVAPLQVMCVLKANAYGLGVAPIARELKEAGAAAFGVAELSEALTIAPLGLPVHILGGLLTEEIPQVVRHGIIAPIPDLATARGLSDEAGRQQRRVCCDFLIDTGMGRLGIPHAEAEAVIRAAVVLPGLDCSGIYTHFPFAYGDLEFSRGQVSMMIELLRRLESDGIRFDRVHTANSDGINNVRQSVMAPFNMARTGINLYGVFDLEGKRVLQLQPVLTLKTRLIAVRELPAGTSIGYGRTCVLQKRTRVGTASIGYADGLPLAMSNRGSLLVRGWRCPVLGRVSMDYTTICLDDVPDAVVGDEVICLGDDISVKEWAEMKGTISYEIICSFGNRLERRCVP